MVTKSTKTKKTRTPLVDITEEVLGKFEASIDLQSPEYKKARFEIIKAVYPALLRKLNVSDAAHQTIIAADEILKLIETR